MQDQRCVHNTRRPVARKRVVYVREWSGGRGRDALAAAVTPHVDTSSVADGDAYVIVVQGGNVGHPSHFVLDLMVQLLIMKSYALSFFFVLCFLYSDYKREFTMTGLQAFVLLPIPNWP